MHLLQQKGWSDTMSKIGEFVNFQIHWGMEKKEKEPVRAERLGEAESEGQTKARPRQREDFWDNLAAVAGYMEENQPGSSSLALALSDAR